MEFDLLSRLEWALGNSTFKAFRRPAGSNNTVFLLNSLRYGS